jgi:hypothetical protein
VCVDVSVLLVAMQLFRKLACQLDGVRRAMLAVRVGGGVKERIGETHRGAAKPFNL